MRPYFLRSIFIIISITIPLGSLANPWIIDFEAPTENRGAGGEFPRDIKFDDMNNDGHIDILVGVPAAFDVSGTGVIYFMLGDGQGGFKADGELKPPVTSYNDFITGDFNNDGLRDIAISQNKFQYYGFPDAACGQTTEGVMIYLGVAGEAPSFEFAQCIRRGVPSDDSTIASGDFNEDGFSDMLVSGILGGSTYSSLGLFYGNGDGTFSTTPVLLGNRVPLVEAVDVNGDGHLDILGKNFLGLLGNGDGTFTTGGISLSDTFPGRGNSYVLADINGDGITDVVNLTTPFGNNDAERMRSQLDVSYFDAAGNKTDIRNIVPSRATAMASGDINGDTFEDIVLSWGGSSVMVLLSTGDGNVLAGQWISVVEGPFYLPPNQNRRIQNGTEYFEVGDLNEDGLLDVGMLSSNPKQDSSLWVALQTGVAPAPDTVAPTVSLLAPVAGSTASGVVTLSASATDNVAVTHVDFHYGTTLVGSSAGPTFSANWDTSTVANGAYALSATAFDAAGNQTVSATVSVTVDNTAPPPPSDFPAIDPNAGTTDVVGVIQSVGVNNVVVNGITVWITPDSIVKFDGVTEIAVGHSIDSKVQPNLDGSMTAIKMQVEP